MSDFVFEPRDEALLGFQTVLHAISARASSFNGRQAALAWPFCASAQAASTLQRRIVEAQKARRAQDALTIGDTPAIEALITRAARLGSLGSQELQSIGVVCQETKRLRRFAAAHREDFPELWRLLSELPDVNALADVLALAITPDGQLADEASFALAKARGEARAVASRLRARMEHMLGDENVAPYLMDSFVSVRNGRFVLPINASFQAKVSGIVHNASQTGQTLFVEPHSIVSEGNVLTILESKVEEAERQACMALSAEVASAEEALRQAEDMLARLDALVAAAHLSDDMGWQVPRFGDDDRMLRLPGLTHPKLALMGHKPTASDVSLADPTKLLIVSGPNAGGKTVLLASVALALTMARAGLPVATQRSALVPWFTGLSCAWGDGQNLSRGLSSFAAQLTALAQMTDQARPNQLLIIDELGGDTDPREGAALAQAILEHLAERGVTAIVTTHLDALRVLPLVDTRFKNARMGLAADGLTPTFRLEEGMAGGSLALKLAERAGLNATILANAQAHLGGGGRVAEALDALEKQRQALAAQQAAVAHEKEETLRERARMMDAQKRDADIAQRDQAATLLQMRQELQDRAQELRQWVSELRRSEDARPAQRALASLEKELAHTPLEMVEARRPSAQAPTDVRVGHRVRMAHLNKEGDVVAIDPEAQMAVVQLGSLRSRVRLEALEVVGAAKTAAHNKAPSVTVLRSQTQDADGTGQGAAGRCDVRGLGAEEAKRAVLRALDGCLSEGTGTLWVIHGHGKGLLREAIRSVVKSSLYVAHWRPGETHEGGDGITVVALDKG